MQYEMTFSDRVEYVVHLRDRGLDSVLEQAGVKWPLWNRLKSSGVRPPNEVVIRLATVLAVPPEFLGADLPPTVVANLERFLSFLKTDLRLGVGRAFDLWKEHSATIRSESFRGEALMNAPAFMDLIRNEDLGDLPEVLSEYRDDDELR